MYRSLAGLLSSCASGEDLCCCQYTVPDLSLDGCAEGVGLYCIVTIVLFKRFGVGSVGCFVSLDEFELNVHRFGKI